MKISFKKCKNKEYEWNENGLDYIKRKVRSDFKYFKK